MGLGRIPHINLHVETVGTNIVYFGMDDGIDCSKVTAMLSKMGVLVDYKGNATFRMVTHKDVDKKAVDYALACFEKIILSQ